MRLVFIGSPDFAVPSLLALQQTYPVIGVVTQPDRPAGRGRQPRPPPVKSAALEAGLALLQPARLRDTEAVACIREWNPDLIVVAAFGQILRQDLLDLPRFGCLNVHASLLPRWRGAAPIPAAILAGDPETGVTIMKMDSGVDTGPILSQRSTPILADDTSQSLGKRLSLLGAELLLETLPRYLEGTLHPTPQESRHATHAPMLTKEAARLDWNRPAVDLERQVRAYNPWPASYFLWAGRRVLLHRAHIVAGHRLEPGRVSLVEGRPVIGTSHSALVLEVLQPAGRAAMAGADFARGARGFVGSKLTSPDAPSAILPMRTSTRTTKHGPD
jgi:methionyl-tRNA formyltransferase